MTLSRMAKVYISLELKSPPGIVNAFLGLPRQGILNMLKTREGKIEIAFRVEGDLSDPHFGINIIRVPGV